MLLLFHVKAETISSKVAHDNYVYHAHLWTPASFKNLFISSGAAHPISLSFSWYTFTKLLLVFTYWEH